MKVWVQPGRKATAKDPIAEFTVTTKSFIRDSPVSGSEAVDMCATRPCEFLATAALLVCLMNALPQGA
jgi:hypothetical protein